MEKNNYEKYCEELKKKEPRTMNYGELGDFRDLILSEAMEEKRPEFMKNSRETIKLIRHAFRILDLQLNLIHGKAEVNGFAIMAIADKFPSEQRKEIAEEIGIMNEKKNKETRAEIDRMKD